MSVDEAVVRALALRPDSPPGDHVIDITTTGARTGLPRRIEIWFHQIDGRFYLTGMPARRGWYANLRKNPQFVVHLKRGVTADLPATAVVVDEQTRQRVIPAVVALQDRPEYAARGVPRQDVDVWLAHSPLVEIVFDDQELHEAAAAE
ncbi:nitroreductase family deazaflavin-dependent oxidoreductase [Actinopolymorpha pittospori]|uniref:Deazaflavin-dependent oxidoreductase (Nitroreductase family) n=1 Tax=Actinopolymorpha pittospori TaxID=648752 RepID=A0A927RHY2_9ACTN|nr:nitroreductase family deazaflavin-dependent oxidoreductase [Actinopolymorpha pittospori]MBE1603978.1 deazaflavin-dependent oxidoreductase (nitroreductase family) [Actinopolymorpha pittospori]